MKTRIFPVLAIFLLLACYSCSHEEEVTPTTPTKPVDSTETVIDTAPVYKLQKEKVYLGEYHTFADVFKPFYYKYTITQTNPNAQVADSVLRAKEAQQENAYKIIDRDGFLDIQVENGGLELNGVDLPFVMRCRGERANVQYALQQPNLLSYIARKWKSHEMACLFTSFDNTDPFALRMRNNTDSLYITFWTKDGLDYVSSSYFNLIDSKAIPNANVGNFSISYKWIYDRFNNREYEDDNGNKYITKITVKKLKDIDGWDADVYVPKSSWNATWFSSSSYFPVVQIYKNDSLYFEGIANHYDEEFGDDFSTGTTYTILNFSMCTKKDGFYYEGGYEWGGHSLFLIRKLDFTKPTDNADFTELGRENIRIVKDSKEGMKGTGSIDDGKGYVMNYNTGW